MLPIRKISNIKVGLTSYFGKLFVTKATYKKDDYGFWFQKQLMIKYEEDVKLKDIVSISIDNRDCEVPNMYGNIARYIKGFRYGNKVFYFEHKTRKTLIKGIDLAKVEKNGVTLVGAEGSTPIVISVDNRLFKYNSGKYNEIDDFITMLSFDKAKAPVEYINVKLFKRSKKYFYCL